MAQLEEYLKQMLTGGMQGLQSGQASGNALRNAIMTKQIEASLTPREYKPRTMDEALEFERAKAGIVKPKEATAEKKNLLQIQDLENKQAEVENLKTIKADSVKESAIDTLKTIDEVEKGITNFGLTGSFPSIPGTKRATWEANINKLLSGKVIDVMVKMKEASKTGATGFGQLSDKEGQILREASTALKRTLSPDDAKVILNDMKVKLQKIAGESYTPYTPGSDIPASSYINTKSQSNERANIEIPNLISRVSSQLLKSPGQKGLEAGLSLTGKKSNAPFDITGSMLPTASYQGMDEIANYVQEFAKPILQGHPEGFINNMVAEIVTSPATYMGITNFNKIKNGVGSLISEVNTMSPKLMTEKWLSEKAGNLQTIGKKINKVKDVIYTDVYSTIGNVPLVEDVSKLIKNSNVPKEVVNEIEKLIGKKITTISQAKQAMDIVKSRIPDAVMKGKTIGKGGLFQKGVSSKNLASHLKEVIYNSVEKVDSRTGQAIRNLDKYMGKEVYPLLDGIMGKVGRYGKPKTAGLVSTFSGSAGKASERLLFKGAPKAIEGLKKFVPTEEVKQVFNKDLLQLSKNMDQVVKDWIKFQTRQRVKQYANPVRWVIGRGR